MPLNILVTLDAHYLRPLKTMLWSLFFNNPGERFHLYLMHASIPREERERLAAFVAGNGHEFSEIRVPNGFFNGAPVLLHYSKEMYFRLVAHAFLPPELERILYLDPDILVINPVRELYETDLKNSLFAACYHNSVPVKYINRLRLGASGMQAYFNSGVLLMNLPLCRERVSLEEINAYVAEYKNWLILPDQDVLNALYGASIKNIPEIRYNYDARFYRYYKLRSGGKIDMDYIMRNTSLLHFCGKHKPWHEDYSGKFHALYGHYKALSERRETVFPSERTSPGRREPALRG